MTEKNADSIRNGRQSREASSHSDDSSDESDQGELDTIFSSRFHYPTLTGPQIHQNRDRKLIREVTDVVIIL